MDGVHQANGACPSIDVGVCDTIYGHGFLGADDPESDSHKANAAHAVTALSRVSLVVRFALPTYQPSYHCAHKGAAVAVSARGRDGCACRCQQRSPRSPWRVSLWLCMRARLTSCTPR